MTAPVRIKCLLGFLLLLAACGRGAQDLPDVAVEVAVLPQPLQVGPAAVKVVLRDAAGQPIHGARVELEGNMSHAGMVPVLAQAQEAEPGLYQASLEFTMAGDWFLLVRANLPDGRSMEHKVDLPGVVESRGETAAP